MEQYEKVLGFQASYVFHRECLLKSVTQWKVIYGNGKDCLKDIQ